jgi:hypothetical protein
MPILTRRVNLIGTLERSDFETVHRPLYRPKRDPTIVRRT